MLCTLVCVFWDWITCATRGSWVQALLYIYLSWVYGKVYVDILVIILSGYLFRLDCTLALFWPLISLFPPLFCSLHHKISLRISILNSSIILFILMEFHDYEFILLTLQDNSILLTVIQARTLLSWLNKEQTKGHIVENLRGCPASQGNSNLIEENYIFICDDCIIYYYYYYYFIHNVFTGPNTTICIELSFILWRCMSYSLC